MVRRRSYWTYSIACFVVWALLLTVTAAESKDGRFHDVLLVFAGWALCWVSATIARSVYPPSRRWLQGGSRPTA